MNNVCRRTALWLVCACLVLLASPRTVAQIERVTAYRIEAAPGSTIALRQRFGDEQLTILEKLNRADAQHLGSLSVLVVPEVWVADELAYSVLPARYSSTEGLPKTLVVFVPGQVFGAYETGTLVRWGPVSTGARGSPTPEGLFSLNWKAVGHRSTVDPDWYMPWYFNFGNREGLAFHQYALPGQPASHGCIRLLERDAVWLFNWGDAWVLDATGTRVRRPGTPVLITGTYDFSVPPPWHSPAWLAQTVQLPPFPRQETSAPAVGCTARR